MKKYKTKNGATIAKNIGVFIETTNNVDNTVSVVFKIILL